MMNSRTRAAAFARNFLVAGNAGFGVGSRTTSRRFLRFASTVGNSTPSAVPARTHQNMFSFVAPRQGHFCGLPSAGCRAFSSTFGEVVMDDSFSEDHIEMDAEVLPPIEPILWKLSEDPVQLEAQLQDLENAEQAQKDSRCYLPVAHRLVLIYLKTDMLADAERVAKAALVFSMAKHGPDSEITAGALMDVGTIHTAYNRLDAAEQSLLRVRAIYTSLGKEDVPFDRCIASLARVYEGQGRLDDAEGSYRLLAAMRERRYGFENPEVSAVLHSLALNLERQKRYIEAEMALRKCIEMRKLENLHPVESMMALAVQHLSELYQRVGRVRETKANYRRLLKMRESFYGVDHTAVTDTLHNYAKFLSDVDDLSTRKRVYDRIALLNARRAGRQNAGVPAKALAKGSALLQTETFSFRDVDPLRRMVDQKIRQNFETAALLDTGEPVSDVETVVPVSDVRPQTSAL